MSISMSLYFRTGLSSRIQTDLQLDNVYVNVDPYHHPKSSKDVSNYIQKHKEPEVGQSILKVTFLLISFSVVYQFCFTFSAISLLVYKATHAYEITISVYLRVETLGRVLVLTYFLSHGVHGCDR